MEKKVRFEVWQGGCDRVVGSADFPQNGQAEPPELLSIYIIFISTEQNDWTDILGRML